MDIDSIGLFLRSKVTNGCLGGRFHVSSGNYNALYWFDCAYVLGLQHRCHIHSIQS